MIAIETYQKKHSKGLLLLFYLFLKGYDLVKELIETTTTKKGLPIKANIINQAYQTKRKVADNFKETMRIIFNKELGKWNYRAIPLTLWRIYIIGDKVWR